jgi:hypothetical protein
MGNRILLAATAAMLVVGSSAAADDVTPADPCQGLRSQIAEQTNLERASLNDEGVIVNEIAALEARLSNIDPELNLIRLDPAPSSSRRARIAELEGRSRGARSKLDEARARLRIARAKTDQLSNSINAMQRQLRLCDAGRKALDGLNAPENEASIAPPALPTAEPPASDESPAPAPRRAGIPHTGYTTAPVAPVADDPNLPADWCLIQREIMVGAFSSKEFSVARCDNLAGLGPAWQVLEANLTFPQAHRRRVALRGGDPGHASAPPPPAPAARHHPQPSVSGAAAMVLPVQPLPTATPVLPPAPLPPVALSTAPPPPSSLPPAVLPASVMPGGGAAASPSAPPAVLRSAPIGAPYVNIPTPDLSRQPGSRRKIKQKIGHNSPPHATPKKAHSGSRKDTTRKLKARGHTKTASRPQHGRTFKQRSRMPTARSGRHLSGGRARIHNQGRRRR